jgi:hypothetical protein
MEFYMGSSTSGSGTTSGGRKKEPDGVFAEVTQGVEIDDRLDEQRR